jgi:glycosyltransferase involved in cell wall biosynthesis
MNTSDTASHFRKKILLITDSYWPLVGGVENWVHALAADLANTHEVSIITHASGTKWHSPFLNSLFPEKPAVRFDDSGIPVITLSPGLRERIMLLPLVLWHFPFIRKVCPKGFFDFLFIFYRTAFSRRLRKLIKNADIVHSFSTGYLGVLATRVCERNLVPLIHSPPVHFDKWGDTPLLLKSYARARAIMCLSNDFKNEFLKRMPGASCEIIVNPAPVKDQGGHTGPRPYGEVPFVLFLGRREEHKGAAMLASAFAHISAQARLVFAGPGPSLNVPNESIEDRGEVDEQTKRRLLESCDIFCVPSRDESFGIVYVEAMMHGKPVIALNVAPVNEIVVHNETGLLVAAAREDLLTKALEELLSNKQLRDKFGANGRKRYEEVFEDTIVMKRTRELYSRILG